MIQPRVNQGLIALVKRGLVYFYGSAQAFGNIITGQLDVQSTRMSSGSLGDFKETTDLVHDVFQATGLVTIGRSNGIAMHRIVDPKWRSSGGFDTLHNGWQLFANGICAHTNDEGQAPWFAVGIKLFHEFHSLIDRGRWPELHTDWVTNTGKVVYMRAIHLAGSFAYPNKV